MLRLCTWRLSTSSFILHVYMRLLNFIWSMHFAVIRARISRIHRLAVRLLLIFDFSSGYLLPIDYLSLRHLGGSFCSWEFSTSLSCCFESPVLGNSLLLYLFVLDLLFFGVLYFLILSFWKLHCLREDLFWSLRLLGERPIVFHFPRCQFRDVAQGSDRMIISCSLSGALISSQAFIFGPSFVSETGSSPL